MKLKATGENATFRQLMQDTGDIITARFVEQEGGGGWIWIPPGRE